MEAVQHNSPRKGRIPTEKQFISLVPSKSNGSFTQISARKAQMPHFKRNPNGIPSNLEEKAKAMKKARIDGLGKTRIGKRDVLIQPSISNDLDGEFGDLNMSDQANVYHDDGGFGDMSTFDSYGGGTDDENDACDEESHDADDEDDGYDEESLETTHPERRQQLIAGIMDIDDATRRSNCKTKRKRRYPIIKAKLERNWDAFILAVTGRLAITLNQSPLCACSKVVEIPSISFHGMSLPNSSKEQAAPSKVSLYVRTIAPSETAYLASSVSIITLRLQSNRNMLYMRIFSTSSIF